MTDTCVNDPASLKVAMHNLGKLKTIEGLLNTANSLMGDVMPHTYADCPAIDDVLCDVVKITDDFKEAISDYEQGG